MLTGFVQIPFCRIARARRFMLEYNLEFTKRLEKIYKLAEDKLAQSMVGERSFARGFYLVETTLKF